MTQLTGDQSIEDARRIVFELTMRPGYDLPFSTIKPLAEYFGSLPNHPDIIWGCSRVPSQNHNVNSKYYSQSKPMKTDIRKKVGKIESEIQELNEKRVAVMIKEAGAALEKLLKEHDALEVRLVKNPHESENIEFEAAPGIRFMQAGRTFRFTRFGLVNKIVQAKVQEIIASGDDEYFMPESDWTPLYMLKKDEDVDRSTLHIDETVEWLAADNYAWEYNIHIPDMFDDNDCDPFDMPYETPSVADCAVADTEESVEETAEREMDTAALLEALNKLSAQKNEAITKFNHLVWIYGMPAIIAKMKELGKNKVYLRDAEDEGYINTGDLWGYFNNGDYAVKLLKLNDDDTLSVVYNTYWNNEDSGESYWGYNDFCGEAVVDEQTSNAIISNIISVLLTNDSIYEVESDEDEDNEDEVTENDCDTDDDADDDEAVEENINEDDDDEYASRLKKYNGKKDMSGALSNLYKLEYIDLSGWDTSNATDISSFLNNCSSLKKVDVSTLSTRSCTDFSCMFLCCVNLQEIRFGSFDTSKATNMELMFCGCDSLVNLDLSSFDTSKITSMESMFLDCESLVDLDLSSFDTSKTTNMESMFRNCESLVDLDLSSFNTECCIFMRDMFSNCSGLNVLNLSNWKLKEDQVLTGSMFACCNKLSRIILKNSDAETLNVIKSALANDDLENVEIITD